MEVPDAEPFERPPTAPRMSRAGRPSSGPLPGPLRGEGTVEVDQIAKGNLVPLADSMKRAFASAIARDLLETIAPAPGLIVALFQDASYFESVRDQYGAFAAAGATVIVGFAGPLGELPKGVYGVDIAGREELADAWGLVVCCGPLTAGLVAVSRGDLLVGGRTLEGSRSFALRFTARRGAIDSVRQLLRPLRGRLSTRALARCEDALRRSEDEPVSPAEDLLVTAWESFVEGIGRSDATRSRRRDDADVDLLTGLYNRRYLARYLAEADASSANTGAVLVDVDGLGEINEKHGVEVGDLVLVQVARTLAAEVGPGDIVGRLGDDEFLVVAASEAPGGALSLAQRLCAAVAACHLGPPLEEVPLSISAGATRAGLADLPDERLVDAVRLAKLLGKNVARLAD